MRDVLKKSHLTVNWVSEGDNEGFWMNHMNLTAHVTQWTVFPQLNTFCTFLYLCTSVPHLQLGVVWA